VDVRRLAVLGAATGALLGSAAHAQSLDTMHRIVGTGTINLGHRESSVPFSYYDGRRQVIGYSHDLMLRVVESIKSELKLPALTIRLVPVTSQNRISLVQNGAVDIECGSTTHNRLRAQQVAFSTSIFVISVRMMVGRNSGIRDFADLGGRKVVVTAATTSERLLRTFNERQGGRIGIILTRDHSDAFQRLESGEAEAFVMDDALLVGERAKARNPEDWTVVGTPMSSEVYGCMMRREDTALKAVVDRSLEALMRSGEARKLYDKWFQQPIPPRGLNLNWPPSPALLQLYSHPNDTPND